MYPTSDEFGRWIRQSGRRKTVVDIYFNGQQIASDLPVTSGSVKVDIDATTRRSGSITIADPGLVPTFDADILSPLGAEARIRQGVVYPDGTESLVPLGVFRLDVTSWSDAQGSVPTVDIYDRSKAVDVMIGNPISRAGYMASEAILNFLDWFYPPLAPLSPSAVFGPGLTDYRLPGGHIWDSGSHWELISDLARSMGGDLYFDVDGLPRVTVVPDLTAYTPESDAVWRIDAGPDGVLVDAQRSYSREGIYNAVQVVGATPASGPTPFGRVFNLDPTSPLRFGGPFGRIGKEISDPTITTNDQCVIRATAELKKYTGAAYSMDFSAVPNPALDVGDFIIVQGLDGVEQLHIVASLNIPLGPGQFTGTTKGMFLG